MNLEQDVEKSTSDFSWLIILVGFLVTAIRAGIGMQTLGFIVNPMQQEMGWNSSLITLCITLQLVVAAVIGPRVGKLLDTVGAKKILTVGLAANGTMLILISSVQEVWQLAVVMVLFGGVTQACIGGTMIMPFITKWFRKRRGFAMGFVSSGANLGSILIAPIIVMLMGSDGDWRRAWFVIGLIPIVLVAPVVYAVLNRSENKNPAIAEASTPSTGTPSTGTPSTGTPSTEIAHTGTAHTGTAHTGTAHTGIPSTGTSLTGTAANGTAGNRTATSSAPAVPALHNSSAPSAPAVSAVSARQASTIFTAHALYTSDAHTTSEAPAGRTPAAHTVPTATVASAASSPSSLSAHTAPYAHTVPAVSSAPSSPSPSSRAALVASAKYTLTASVPHTSPATRTPSAFAASSVLTLSVPAPTTSAPSAASTVSAGQAAGTYNKEGMPPPEPVFTVAEALRTPVFWKLIIAWNLVDFAMKGALLNKIPYALEMRYTAADGAGILAMYGILAIAGKLAIGWAADKMPLHIIGIILAMFQTAGMYMFIDAPDIFTLYMAYGILSGLSAGGLIALMPIMLANYYGSRFQGALSGITISLLLFSSVGGPMSASIIRDITGSYKTGFLLYSFLTFIAVILFMFIRKPKKINY